MVNSVSAVQTQPQVQNAIQNKVGAMDKITQEELSHPGYYVVSPVKGLYEVPEPEYKKKGGFLKFLGKVILTAVIVGGAAVGARKFIPALGKDSVDVSEGLAKNAGFGKTVKFRIAQLGDWVEKIVKKPFEKKSSQVAKNESSLNNNTPNSNAGDKPADTVNNEKK